MKKIIIEENTINQIICDYKEGISVPNLAIKFETNTRKISNILKENGIKIRGRRKIFYNENYFEKIDTKLKAYWLGFLYADGCVRNIKNAYLVKIKLSKLDEKHLFSLIQHIGSNQTDLRTEVSKFRGVNGKEYVSNAKTLLINSKKMVEDLINNGCYQNKTKTIKFPNLNPEFIPSFILGYFDGDGCITQSTTKTKKYFRITFTCGSEMFLDSIKNELLKAGIDSISKYNYKTFFRLQISNKIDLLRLKDYFYKKNDFYLDRKKTKFDKL